MEDRTVRVGLIQTKVSDDMERNLERSIGFTEEAIQRGAQIICLQELYRTPYFPQYERCDARQYAETVPGPSTKAFSALAREHRVVIIVPLFEQAGKGVFYNTAVVINSKGEIQGTYRKVHVPFDPLFYEKQYFRPGDGFSVHETEFGRIGVLICYDQWFPEAARILTLQGADIIFYPTAIGWIHGEECPAEGDWQIAWETVQRGHAIANGIHIAAINRVGRENDLVFWGSSFVSDAFGTVIRRASDRNEEVLVVDVNIGMNREVREGWGFLRNRRPDAYGALTGHSPVLPTPLGTGFKMPAEWEPHEAVWLSWPHDRRTFPALDEVETAYTAIIRALHREEKIHLLVNGRTMEAQVRQMLNLAGVAMDRVMVHVTTYADVWFRDYGPTFIVNKKERRLAMVTWQFNAWGGKYTDLAVDARIPSLIKEWLGIDDFQPGIILEGGSIEVNGQGTVMTTEQCLLNVNRNPHLSRKEIEQYLGEYLGIRNVIWLKEGIAGDDTDGHIDDIARFVDPHTILCGLEDDPNNENYPVLRENYRILREARDQDERPFRVIPIPMPGMIDYPDCLPASYLNFYIGNNLVLVPIFGVRNDRAALSLIGQVSPGRTVVGIDCRAMVQGLGSLHCITQQQPSV